MSDVRSILVNSECDVVSCVDIKDVYHSIPLTERSKEFCGILPYFGSPIYRYEVLPMGIACVPQIWMDYITLILGELKDKSRYIAIMDDLLVHSSRAAHWRLLEQLFKSMCKNGLRLSPKKCQLFKTWLTYMGNEFVISEKTMTITPLRSRIEALHIITYPQNSNAMQELLWICELSITLLSRFANIVETHSRINLQRQTLCMGQRTRSSLQ